MSQAHLTDRGAYAALDGDDGHNPVDEAIDRLPKMAALRRRALRLLTAVQAQVKDQRLFLRWDEVRNEYACARDELLFDAGHGHGRLAGAAESLAASASAAPAARALARPLMTAATVGKLPRERLVALLLEVARAVALGISLPGGAPTLRRRMPRRGRR